VQIFYKISISQSDLQKVAKDKLLHVFKNHKIMNFKKNHEKWAKKSKAYKITKNAKFQKSYQMSLKMWNHKYLSSSRRIFMQFFSKKIISMKFPLKKVNKNTSRFFSKGRFLVLRFLFLNLQYFSDIFLVIRALRISFWNMTQFQVIISSLRLILIKTKTIEKSGENFLLHFPLQLILG